MNGSPREMSDVTAATHRAGREQEVEQSVLNEPRRWSGVWLKSWSRVEVKLGPIKNQHPLLLWEGHIPRAAVMMKYIKAVCQTLNHMYIRQTALWESVKNVGGPETNYIIRTMPILTSCDYVWSAVFLLICFRVMRDCNWAALYSWLIVTGLAGSDIYFFRADSLQCCWLIGWA